MRWFRLSGLLLAGACASASAWAQPANPPAAACKVLQASGNPQYPPYLWRDPADEARLVGANAELMDWLAQEIGVPIELRYVGNWARVQEEARVGRVDLIAGAFFTLPRTEYLDYSFLPFRETRSVVIQRKSTPFPFQKWADLRDRSGLTVINNSFGQAFDRYATESLKLTKVSSLDQALQMLQLGRGDYVLYEESPAEAYMARLNLTGLKMVMPPIAQEQLYLALSHRSACNTPELRGAINRAVYKLQQGRLMQGFIDKAVQHWRDQERKSP